MRTFIICSLEKFAISGFHCALLIVALLLLGAQSPSVICRFGTVAASRLLLPVVAVAEIPYFAGFLSFTKTCSMLASLVARLVLKLRTCLGRSASHTGSPPDTLNIFILEIAKKISFW